MKTTILSVAAATLFCLTTSFTVPFKDAPKAPQGNQITISTDGNGQIMSTTTSNAYYRTWQITDLSGTTNIRNKPNGKICMKLKAWTQYNITTCGQSKGWLQIVSIYNLKEEYQVRLHSSSTGTYWISKSILYEI